MEIYINKHFQTRKGGVIVKPRRMAGTKKTPHPENIMKTAAQKTKAVITYGWAENGQMTRTYTLASGGAKTVLNIASGKNNALAWIRRQVKHAAR
jgi:hypothetical protein